MKKALLIFFILIGSLSTISQAQRYSINKLKYDSNQYFPEPWDAYNPTMSGVASFIIPGLGQVTCGETLRGLAFFGGYAISGIICLDGMTGIWSENYYPPSIETRQIMFLAGACGMIAMSIWSITDAVKVAKVNSMYIRDLRKMSQIRFEMSPYIDQLSINNQLSSPIGMTMRVKF